MTLQSRSRGPSNIGHALATVGAGALVLLGMLVPAAYAAGVDYGPEMAPPERAAGSGLTRGLNQLGLTGSLRSGIWSSNRLYDDVGNVGTASNWLKLEKKLNSGLGLYAEGYAAREDVRSNGDNRSRVREAYLEGRAGAFDFRVGKQIIAWGRADRLNPTDNLTGRDATLMGADIDEDRFGSVAAKGSWNVDAYTSLSAIWLPEFAPNKIFLRPGFSESTPTGSRQWALKMDQSGKTIDWSLSYFDGYDLAGDLSAALRIQHYRTKVIGMDAATSVGSYRFALESAYTMTEDPDGNNEFVKNPFVYTVFGVEHDFGNETSGIVQIFNRHVLNYSTPSDAARLHAIFSSQLDRNQNGVSLRIAKKWWNQTLETELAGSSLIERRAYSVRPRITYLWSDSIKLLAGYEYYQGGSDTLFGYLKKNNVLFAELRYFY